MPPTLYRKTAAGQAEVRERRLGLDARARTLLILCNGRLDAAALAAQTRLPAQALLQLLCELGLLEPVPGAAVAPVKAPPAPAVAPAPPAPPPAPNLALQLPAIVQRGWLLLEPLFGPGTRERLAPLQRATDATQLRKALDDLRDTMAIYQGRKSAAALVQRIEHG
jgi:hypothetical protein